MEVYKSYTDKQNNSNKTLIVLKNNHLILTLPNPTLVYLLEVLNTHEISINELKKLV